MEYSINVDKLQTMKAYDMSKNIFLTLVHYSLLALVLVLFLSSLLWIPTLCSSLNLFLLETLPKTIAVVSSPKCLFVVFNLIIIFLVGESRLTSSSSPKLDIYEEYVIHNHRLKGLPSGEGKMKESVADIPLVEEKKEEVMEENVVESPLAEEKEEEEVKKEMVVESSMVEEKVEEEVKEEMVESVEEEEEVKVECEVLKEEEEKEEKELSAEELNRRVEAFIAMVNMQMRLEARMVVCCG